MTWLAADSSLVPLVVAIGLGLTVVFAGGALVALRSPVHAVRGRVTGLTENVRPYSADSSSVLRGSRGWRRSPIGRLLQGANNEQLQLRLDRAGFPLRVGEYLAIRIAAVVLAAGLIMALFGLGAGWATASFGAVLGAVVGLVAPPMALRIAARRRASKIETQLVELCELMASMLRSGYGYTQALASTAAEMEDPLASELIRLVDTVRLGGDVDEALEELNERLGSREFDIMATAISIQRRSGGNLSEILDGVAETIRNRQTFHRELSALTARERFSAVIVAGLPLVLVALLTLMDPGRYSLLFTDTRGQVVLGLALVMNLVGYLTIKRVSKVEV
jgi:tight adherence protein B